MNHHELPRGISLQRPAWWRPGEAIDRTLTHEELARIKTPRAAPATPAAAPVEDEPSGSGSKRRKILVDPIARDWFLDMLDQWRRERRWDMQRCLCEVQRLCPGVFDGVDKNTPYRWKRSAPRAETRGRRSLLSPADMTRLSEHIMRGDRRHVLERGDDQRLGVRMARRRGARRASRRYLGQTAPAWHALEPQEAR